MNKIAQFMIEKLTSLLKNEALDDYDVEILKYGITTVVLNLPKTILIILLGKKLRLLKPLLLFFVFYGIIRNFSRGIHAKTPFVCLVLSTALYLSTAYLSKVIVIPKKLYNFIFTYCLCVYLKYAPSGTEVNPVYKDQIMPLKIRAMLTIIIYYIIGLKNELLRNIVALSLLSQSIFIIPLTFKLANQKGGVVHDEDDRYDC